jgi:hypothetical protein
MKRFSVWAFIVVTMLHVIVSVYVVGGAVGASYAQEKGVPDHSTAWNLVLWIWDTVPMLLAPYFRPLRPIHIVYLILPWSIMVGVCFGFVVPRVFASRPHIA